MFFFRQEKYFFPTRALSVTDKWLPLWPENKNSQREIKAYTMKEIIRFLRELKQHNDRAWFNAHKEQ